MREKYQITNLHMLKSVVIPHLRKQHFKMAPNLSKPSFRSRIANYLEDEEADGRPMFVLPDHLIFFNSDSDNDSDIEMPLPLPFAPPPTPRNQEWVELGRGMEMLTGLMPLDYEMYLVQQLRAFNQVEQYAELPEPNSLSREDENVVLRNFLLEGFLWNQELLSPDQVERAAEDLFDFFRQEVETREEAVQPHQQAQPQLVARWNRANEDEVDLQWLDLSEPESVAPELPQQIRQLG